MAVDEIAHTAATEVYDPTPGPAPSPVVMTQSWTKLTYLHWPYPPEAVAPLLPAGTRPDVIGGVTWIGLIAFVMRDVSLLGTPPIPYLSNFLETNVRAYAIDDAGRRSVVFFSLDASRALPVAFARASYRIPYIWSHMRARQDGDECTYFTRRRRGGPSSRFSVRAGAPVAEPTALDHFLTARWGLHSRWYGITSYVPIVHEPWPLRRAELLDLDDGLVQAAGLPAPAGDPHVLYSEGVHVRLGLPTILK